ncbi:ketosteroid isomerase-like protein [Nocardia transvalensis]|uniref:Ketosteroid isomerase-like protein n=1 Tax=Nocardia transvalensis TaxID=37333 RepID=A0A7W9UKJ4_9NOCA|nr:ester cyclase [Nocardia transvalensis]MBB5916623.1 ketosteroid isomerase-like protein [Nocardia transvalensis]
MINSSPQDVVLGFLIAFAGRDPDRAVAHVADGAAVNVYALGVHDSGATVIRTVVEDLLRAFPDLIVTVKKVVTTGNVVTAEIKIQGTQANSYAGAINQEKHLDLDEVWRFAVEGDRITRIDAYWCQQQLYRRLGVKRFDHVALV